MAKKEQIESLQEDIEEKKEEIIEAKQEGENPKWVLKQEELLQKMILRLEALEAKMDSKPEAEEGREKKQEILEPYKPEAPKEVTTKKSVVRKILDWA